jgi:hypothetical protein
VNKADNPNDEESENEQDENEAGQRTAIVPWRLHRRAQERIETTAQPIGDAAGASAPGRHSLA